MPVDSVDDLAVHLDQATVRVEGEALVPRGLGKPLGCGVAEAEVENGVHHPGHRDRRARPNRDEQGIAGIAEALAGLLLEPDDVSIDLLVEPLRNLAAACEIRAAGICRNREAGGDGHAQPRHLRQAGPFSAQQFASGLDFSSNA